MKNNSNHILWSPYYTFGMILCMVFIVLLGMGICSSYHLKDKTLPLIFISLFIIFLATILFLAKRAIVFVKTRSDGLIFRDIFCRKLGQINSQLITETILIARKRDIDLQGPIIAETTLLKKLLGGAIRMFAFLWSKGALLSNTGMEDFICFHIVGTNKKTLILPDCYGWNTTSYQHIESWMTTHTIPFKKDPNIHWDDKNVRGSGIILIIGGALIVILLVGVAIFLTRNFNPH